MKTGMRTMRRIVAGFALLVAINASALAAAPVQFTCREERGGW